VFSWHLIVAVQTKRHSCVCLWAPHIACSFAVYPSEELWSTQFQQPPKQPLPPHTGYSCLHAMIPQEYPSLRTMHLLIPRLYTPLSSFASSNIHSSFFSLLSVIFPACSRRLLLDLHTLLLLYGLVSSNILWHLNLPVLFCYSSNRSLCFPWRKLRIIRGIETLCVLRLPQNKRDFPTLQRKSHLKGLLLNEWFSFVFRNTAQIPKLNNFKIRKCSPVVFLEQRDPQRTNWQFSSFSFPKYWGSTFQRTLPSVRLFVQSVTYREICSRHRMGRLISNWLWETNCHIKWEWTPLTDYCIGVFTTLELLVPV
jgi:hypothetical protein